MTRNAANVAAGDVANLEQVGLRGLIRVIDSEHPHLSATQIDVDAATEPKQVALQLKSGSEEDETAWRDGDWYTARLFPGPLRAEPSGSARSSIASGTACACRSARRVTSKRWNSPSSTASRPDRGRSR